MQNYREIDLHVQIIRDHRDCITKLKTKISQHIGYIVILGQILWEAMGFDDGQRRLWQRIGELLRCVIGIQREERDVLPRHGAKA